MVTVSEYRHAELKRPSRRQCLKEVTALEAGRILLLPFVEEGGLAITESMDRHRIIPA